MGEFGKLLWLATGNAAAIETNKNTRLPETKFLPIFITYKSCIPNLPYGAIIGLKALRDVERQLALPSTGSFNYEIGLTRSRCLRSAPTCPSGGGLQSCVLFLDVNASPNSE